MADEYMYWLDTIEGLGKTSKVNLLQAFGSAKEVYVGNERLVNCILEEKKQVLFKEAKKRDIYKAYEKLDSDGIRMASLYDKDYPEKLKYIPDSPFGIYYKGRLPEEVLPAVAIIGARECSQYGEYVAEQLGKSLGEAGIQVISGLARGIDGISQNAALAVGGSSFGVLGCGVDVCYPKSNKKIYEMLLEKGGILSSYPPGTMPMAKLFPPRNRIVSGLADVLVVIEARQRSGTSITVEMALEQGRDIYAVPGRVTDRLSDGCNKMIKDGAHVFLSPQDFVEDLKSLLPQKMERCMLKSAGKLWEENNIREEKDTFVNADDKVAVIGDKTGEIVEVTKGEEVDLLMKAVMEVLDFYPQPMEKIMELLRARQGMEVKQEELSAKLMIMCLYGLVKQDSAGWFSKIINI